MSQAPLAAYRLGDLVRLKISHGRPFVAGAVGKVAHIILQLSGWWYQVTLAGDWLWIKEGELERAPTTQTGVNPMNNRDDDGWDLFVPPRQVPVKLRSDGKLVLSKEAHEVLGDHVELLWHAARHALALRRAAKQDAQATLKVASGGRGGSQKLVEVGGLLARNHIGPLTVAGEYMAVEEHGMFVVQLPASREAMAAA